MLLIDSDTPRFQWKMTRVTKTKLSKAGIVRSVTLHLGQDKELECPIEKQVTLLPVPYSHLLARESAPFPVGADKLGTGSAYSLHKSQS